MRAATLLLLVCLAGVALADVYMHNPRGSNNRLNERSANRNNGNRMFDSQNNNRGGYNKGDVTDDRAFANGNGFEEKESLAYDFQYYMSSAASATSDKGRSILHVEWTNQHGCGGNEHDDPHKLNCNILLQYMCVPIGDEDEVFSQDATKVDCGAECRFPRYEANQECTNALQDQWPCYITNDFQTRLQCLDAGGLWYDGDLESDPENAPLMYNRMNCPHNCAGSTDDNKASCGDADWQTHNGGRTLTYPRDGFNTNRVDFQEPNDATDTEAERLARKTQSFNTDDERERGVHESWEWYDECYRRERNRGLFTADQNLRNNQLGYSSAVYTRQNPNNNRRGYECPEERDYWPYWHPSPWVDIVVMTDRLDLCPFFQSESQNVKGKGICRNKIGCPNCIRYNQKERCENNGGSWVTQGPHGVPKPDCVQSEWSRVNHLGNGRFGQPNAYNWTLPRLTLGNTNKAVEHRCVLRLRYNISTDDYDAWKVNSSFNNNNGQGVVSPVRQNPNVDIGAKNTALRLAINTAQFGRTFQDRSHVFRLLPRTDEDRIRNGNTPLTSSRPSAGLNGNEADFFGDRTLYNLNVRGKRGNIVQTFPSVEYDFMPNHLHVKESDLVHVQWTGSNTHNNGNPAGDGQAGDAGEGRGGTDRHNFVELKRFSFEESFPATWEENTIFANLLDALDANVPKGVASEAHSQSVNQDSGRDWASVKRDWALRMASAGYYSSYDDTSVSSSFVRRQANGQELQELLNNANPSYPGGIFRFKRGIYNYMCTRNHNFSNRDQKGHLVVEADEMDN